METDERNSSEQLETHDAELERNELQWVPWLRGVMWVNIAVAVFATIYGLYAASFVPTLYSQAKAVGRMWLTPDLAIEILVTLGLPLLHLYASIGCFHRKPPARLAMVIFCWCKLGMIVIRLFGYTFRMYGLYVILAYLLRNASPSIYEAAFSVLTLLFITRTPIKSLFGHHPIAGFAVLPGAQQEKHEQTQS